MKNKKGKTIAKQNLPSKLCVVCERPFTWRKKWEANWDEVTTCSKSCNAKRKQQHKKQEKVQTTATPASSAAVVSVPKNTSGKYDDGSSPFYKTAAVVSSSFPAPKIKDSTSPTTSTVATTNCHEEESSLSVVASAQEGVEDDNICSPNTGTSIVSSDEEEQDGEELVLDPKALKKLLRKQRKDSVKAQKQERRLKREGKTTQEVGRKECDLCDKSVDLLIRCTIDATQQYRLVCGTCWPSVSGGVTDGNLQTHPHYNYGGVWKNRNATQNKRIGDGRRRTK